MPALRIEIQAYEDPFVSPTVAEEAHVKLRSLEEVLQTSDYLTLHSTLNDETRHLLGKETLAKVKNGERGQHGAGPADGPDALLNALESGRAGRGRPSTSTERSSPED